MLNLPSTTAVTWTTPPTSTPVGPVTAVKPVSAASRERQAGLGPGQHEQSPPRSNIGGRETQARPQEEVPAHAPLLPREGQTDPAGTKRSREASARQVERERQAQELADQEADKALREKLKAVLSAVWQASAAVVERALGREPANEVPGPRSSASAELSVGAADPLARRPLLPELPSPVQVDPLPWPIMPSDASAPSGLSEPMPLSPEEVVAYDERGNTSAAPLEVGSLVSRRV